MFPAYVINLDRATARWAKVQEQMRPAGFELTRIAAVDSRSLTREQKAIYSNASELRPGEMACGLSHIKAWQQLVDDKHAWAVVLEDDALTYASKEMFGAQIELAFKHRPNLDLLYMGKCCDQCANYKYIAGNVFEGVAPYCTHAYLITRQAALRLLDSVPIAGPIDEHLASLNRRQGLKSLAVHPSMITQDVITSTSELRSNQAAYDNIIECRDAPLITSNLYTNFQSTTSTSWLVWVVILAFVLILFLVLKR